MVWTRNREAKRTEPPHRADRPVDRRASEVVRTGLPQGRAGPANWRAPKRFAASSAPPNKPVTRFFRASGSPDTARGPSLAKNTPRYGFKTGNMDPALKIRTSHCICAHTHALPSWCSSQCSNRACTHTHTTHNT